MLENTLEWPFKLYTLSLSALLAPSHSDERKLNDISKTHFLMLKRKRLSLSYNTAKDLPARQENRHRRRNSFDHKGEKCGIKIQGQALMFTQEETRT